MKKGYYVIDSHCHIYPEKIAAKAVAATDKFYGDVVSFSKGTTSDLVSVCKKTGIDHAIVQSVATNPAQVKSINEFIAGEVQKSNGFLTGLGTLHPDSGDISGDVEHIISLGLKGVKLHPDIQQFQVDKGSALKIYEICEKKNLVILMHTGDYRYDNSNPNRVVPVLKEYPKLTLIGAHLGGWSVWEEACEKMAHIPNLYVDCSSSFGFSEPEKIKEIIMAYGEDKVIFGTDYPMWNAEKELNTFLSLELGESFYRKALSENAKKIFNL